jgi:hypothetical protein
MEELKMTEIEKIEGEIKVFQAKLDLLKEMENHKSPEEKSYKRWYGNYPLRDPSVSNFEDNRWKSFQIGYKAAKEDWKVGEEPKPESLEDILWEWWEDAFTSNSNLDMEATLAGLADKVYSWHEKLQ